MRTVACIGAVMMSSALLAACATHSHDMDHHAMNDSQSMCAMHKQMMAGKTAAEQQALEQEHMRSMSPEMRQNMQEMLSRCR